MVSDANLGATSGSLSFDGGTLRHDGFFILHENRAITLGLGGGKIDTNGYNPSIAQAITGSGNLVKLGAGTLSLLGANTYSGLTAIDGGAVQIGLGGTTGRSLAMFFNNASLVFNRSDDIAFAGVISGIGDVTKNGAGKLTLTGSSSYSGGTIINGAHWKSAAEARPGRSMATSSTTVPSPSTAPTTLRSPESSAAAELSRRKAPAS